MGYNVNIAFSGGLGKIFTLISTVSVRIQYMKYYRITSIRRLKIETLICTLGHFFILIDVCILLYQV